MGKKKNILIIEQDINRANGLKAIMEREGYYAFSASSSYMIKDVLEGKEPDLIIINIDIAKETGLNILRKTKESFPLAPLIAMSVYGNSFSAKELRRLRMDDFIAKPFDLDKVKQKIEELLGKRKQAQIMAYLPNYA